MARKSRQNRYFPEKTEAKWKAGVYARLSVSDNRVYGESLIYQLKLAQEALLSKPDISFVKNYVDDGYSGMHFNRPAFQSMLEDLKCGIINCVIVKDVSRIGRDYLGACELLLETFPDMGVRFISINDNYDNVSDVDELIALEMILRTIMHYGTAIDTSKKVKSAIDAKVQSGTFLPASGSIPYGYLRDPANNTYAIDPETRLVIHRIFKLRSQGYGYTAIAQALNKDDIPCPGKLKYLRGASKKASFADAIWQKNVIRSILHDQVYIGNRVHGKVKKDSLRLPKHTTDEEEWTIIEDAHPAIISKELFDAVQAINQAEIERLSHYQKRAEVEHDNRKLLNGRLICGDCGKRITSSKNAAKPGSSMESYVYYDCGLYRTSNRTMCSSHFTRDDVLIKIVERAVAQHVPHILVAEYVTEHIGVMEDRRDEIQSEIRELQEKSNRIGQWYENVFEHAESFDLPESVYKPNAQKMRKKQLDIQARCEELIDEDHKLARMLYDSNQRLELCKQYAKSPKLTSELLDSLIDRIVIYADKRICVHFKYNDECYQEMYSGRV